MSTSRPAVFLDRDGVLNRCPLVHNRPHPPANVDHVELFPGVKQACEQLRSAGYLLICVTNQPDVARGLAKRKDVEAINAHIREALALDDLLTSYDDGDHPRRKPNPGMLLEAATQYHIDLARSVMVGDRWKDIEAGRRAGCMTVFIDHEYDESRPEPPADLTVTALIDAVEWIIGSSGRGQETGDRGQGTGDRGQETGISQR